MKTNSDVDPALMNGNGKPVGGIEPDTTAMLSIVWIEITAPIPKQRKAENLLFARMPIIKIFIIIVIKIAQTNKQPTKPSSSAIIEKIKSLSRNGKNYCACLLLKSPTPHIPPLPIA